MKKNISQKQPQCKNEISQVQEQFTGKNLTRFGGSGLIGDFFRNTMWKTSLVKESLLRVEGIANTAFLKC